MLRRTLAVLAFAGGAYAQEPQADGSAPPAQADAPAADTIRYDAAYFAQFSPQSALDMASQTPGFSIDDGDGRRGFSGAVGNVLIDGVRPSTKSQSLSDLLSRIPADQVLRIELLRGTAIAGDASGQAVLLNVVRTPVAGGGIWELGAEYGGRERAGPRGEASYSGRTGQLEYGLGASFYDEYRATPGHRRVFDGVGALTETVTQSAPRHYDEWDLNGNVAAPLWGGRGSLNAQVDGWSFGLDETLAFATPAGAPASTLTSDFVEDETSFELGAGYERDFGPWSLALIALADRTTYESDETARAYDDAGVLALTASQALESETGESILRAALSRRLGAHRVEFGAEGAFNTLEQSVAYTEDDGGGPVVIAIPNANVRVEEERAELFVADAWRLTERWSLESRLNWETSTLSFSGDANQSVSLSFWKPSLQLTRTIGENNQARVRIYRDVGQLDFDDFVSAADLTDNLIAGGNPDLEPETSWRIELGTDWRFSSGAALALTLAHHRISDVADVVLIVAPGANPGDPPILFDAPGNIGDGEETILTANFSTPLGRLLPGGQLTLEGYVRDSEVTDPVTGRPRIISDRPESGLDLELRQDLNSLKLSWGVVVAAEGEEQEYRFDEIDTEEEGPWVDLFVETTALPNDMRLRLTLENITDAPFRRDRRFFTPDRGGALNGQDVRTRRFEGGTWAVLEISGSF